jgi:hypothetical protein
MRNLVEYTHEDIIYHEEQLVIVKELILKLEKDKYHHEQMLIILKNRLERKQSRTKN